MGGGKGSSSSSGSQPQQVNSTSTTSNLPQYAQPYYEDVLNRATSISNSSYTPYTGQRVADFTPEQGKGMGLVQNNVGSYLPDFNNAATSYGQASFNPQQSTNTYNAQTLTPKNWTDSGVSQQYMDPYVQNVLNQRMDEASRQFNIQGRQQQQSAQQAGAFGGYRQGLVEAENNRNQNINLAQIEGQGMDTAYNTGIGAFNQDRSAQIGANQLNNQFGQAQSSLGMQAAAQNNAAGQAAGQLALNRGQGQAALGAARQQAGLTDAQAMLNIGGMSQALNQQKMDTAYNDFVAQRDYNRQNINWLSGILHGVPTSANTTVAGYQTPPSQISQIAGLGLGGIGLSKLMS